MIIPSASSPRSALRAMTLAEVIIALGILAFSALALVELTYQIRRMAEDNVHQNTALVMAQGYLEQLCRLPYTSPAPYSSMAPAGVANIADDNTVPIYLINSSGHPATSLTGGSLCNGGSSKETVFLDQDTSGNPTFPMTFQFTPVLTDLNTLTGGSAKGVEITIYFTATYNLGSPRTFSSSVRTVRASVPVM